MRKIVLVLMLSFVSIFSMPMNAQEIQKQEVEIQSVESTQDVRSKIEKAMENLTNYIYNLINETIF